MNLVLGCPVANREWVLPRWFDAIARQTVRPQRLTFVHSGERGDATWRALLDGAKLLNVPVQLTHVDRPPHPRTDNARFETLADLRNLLLELAIDDGYARSVRCDVFMSLDSDVILTDPTTIERLVGQINGYDLVAPRFSLHPNTVDGWALNAGFWNPDSTRADAGTRRWYRPSPDQAEPVRIDIPMAAWVAKRWVIQSCRYRWHESGEDLGFAQDLEEYGVHCVWMPEIRAHHVWNERALEEVPA